MENEKEKYYILALDIGNKRSGYAVFDLNSRELIKFGGITGPCIKGTRTGAQRWVYMRKKLMKQVKDFDFKEIVVEKSLVLLKTAYGTFNFPYLHSYYAVAGALISGLENCNPRIFWINPMCWYSALGLQGRASAVRKETSIAFAYINFPEQIDNKEYTGSYKFKHDIADAINIGFWWVNGHDRDTIVRKVLERNYRNATNLPNVK